MGDVYPDARTTMGMHAAVDLVEALHLNRTATTRQGRRQHARAAQNIADKCDAGPTIFAFATLVLMLAEAHAENIPGLFASLRRNIPDFEPGPVDAGSEEATSADQAPHPYSHIFPDPPKPDLGEPSVMSSESGHLQLLVYPFADDDADRVFAQFGPLIDALQELVEEMRGGQ